MESKQKYSLSLIDSKTYISRMFEKFYMKKFYLLGT